MRAICPFLHPKPIGRLLLLLASAIALPEWELQAEVKMPAIFSDNMVLQQEIAMPVWGKADPGEKVIVTVAGQTVSTSADENGKWRVKLPPMKADGKPLTLTVSAKNKIVINNVLLGEVWLGSGQSNMQMSVMNVANAQAEMAAATYPQIRTFAVKRRGWPQPLEDVEGVWLISSPETINRFSAVLYFFGRDLHQQIHQPIGLINSSYGGTIIQSWMRWDVLMSDPETKTQAEARVKELDDSQWVEKKFTEDTTKYTRAVEKAKAENKPLQMAKPSKVGPEEKSRPGGLYNGMIHPLLGYGMRGILWYQGEYNVGQAEQYARLFPKMIADWRQQWGLGELPFFFVQLPPISKPQDTPMLPSSQTAWAALREAQSRSLSVPNTAMAVTIDTAADGDLHPKDKQPVGNRLALLAAHQVYRKETASFSPMYRSHSREGTVMRLNFARAEGGLLTKDGGSARGFAVAGADRNFVWAEAKIEGEQVIVSSPGIMEPVAVRYGWANHPVISVFNKKGLPLAPFRTDDWE